MSNSENVSLWKEKAKIDYIPLFISLWFSLNAWMNNRFNRTKDRDILELLKRGQNPLEDRFSELINSNSAKGSSFKGNFAELHGALKNANICYERTNNQYIHFQNSIVDRNNGNPEFGTILKGKGQHNIIEIDEGIYLDNDQKKLFAVYIEITYQIRCLLFHDTLFYLRVRMKELLSNSI